MPIKFAAICPHPPIMIPEVGTKDDLDKVFKTIHALKSLAIKFKEKKIDTVIIFTPHGNSVDNISVYSSNSFTTSLPGALLGFSGDVELSEKISLIKNIKKIEEGNLDHGSSVPLYYFKQSYSSFKIVPISYSLQSPSDHFNFGKELFEIIKEEDKKIAIIASGDFCHRLSPSAPAGFSEKGKEFDETILSMIQKNKINNILNFDPKKIKEAGQCAYKSVLMLLGVLNSIKYTPKLVSYESPFGIGYAVIDYQLSKENENKN